MKLSAFAILAAARTSSSVASSLPKRMLSAIVPVKRCVSCSTMPKLPRSAAFEMFFTLMPS